PFTPWIEQLIVRKRGLGRDDYLAQAAAAVRACLAGGVTTIADCSYADTVAEAAIEQGLRAIVYLEAFSDQGDPAGLMPARLQAPCSAAARRRCRRCSQRGSESGSAPTRRHPRWRSTCGTRCEPRSCSPAPAPPAPTR